MVSYSDESKKATQKFFEFLKAYREKLSIKLAGLKNELVFFDAMKEFKDANYINSLLAMKSYEGLDEDLQKALSEIKYLDDNKISNVPQYRSSMEKILNNKKVMDLPNSVIECKARIKAYELGVEIINKVLAHVPINNAQLIKLLDSSNLTEEEVILVLEDYTFGICPDYERAKEIPKIDIPEIKTQDTEIAFEETDEPSKENDLTIKEYLNFKAKADAFYDKYRFLIESDEFTTRNRRIENGYLIQILESKLDVRREIPYEEKLAILMYQLEKVLLQLRDTAFTSKRLSSDELLGLKFNISTLSSLLKLGTQLEKKVSFDKETSNQRIIFLTDDKEKPLFDFDAQEFCSEDRKKVRSILYRLGTSNVTDDDRISKKVLGTTKRSHNMHVIQESNLRGSFIRLSKDIILVVTFDKSEEIFPKTLRYDNNYYDKIETLKNLACTDPENLIEITTEVTEDVHNSISSTEKKIGGE